VAVLDRDVVLLDPLHRVEQVAVELAHTPVVPQVATVVEQVAQVVDVKIIGQLVAVVELAEQYLVMVFLVGVVVAPVPLAVVAVVVAQRSVAVVLVLVVQQTRVDLDITAALVVVVDLVSSVVVVSVAPLALPQLAILVIYFQHLL
jgi:hypothetical protein